MDRRRACRDRDKGDAEEGGETFKGAAAIATSSAATESSLTGVAASV